MWTTPASKLFKANEEAIYLVNNPVSSQTTQDIDVKHNLIRDAVLLTKVYIVYIETKIQNTGMLTQPLNAERLGKHAGSLMNVR